MSRRERRGPEANSRGSADDRTSPLVMSQETSVNNHVGLKCLNLVKWTLTFRLLIKHEVIWKRQTVKVKVRQKSRSNRAPSLQSRELTQVVVQPLGMDVQFGVDARPFLTSTANTPTHQTGQLKFVAGVAGQRTAGVPLRTNHIHHEESEETGERLTARGHL